MYYIPSIYELTRAYEESQGTVTNNKKSNKSHLSQRRQAALKKDFLFRNLFNKFCVIFVSIAPFLFYIFYNIFNDPIHFVFFWAKSAAKKLCFFQL